MNNNESFHVMVTDINHHVCDLMKNELEREGYTVTIVRNGMEAYNKVLSPTSLDVIILDPELLHPYGDALLWEILQHKSSAQIIIHGHEDRINEFQTGNNIHVVKKNTLNINHLKDKLKSCLKPKAGTY